MPHGCSQERGQPFSHFTLTPPHKKLAASWLKGASYGQVASWLEGFAGC